MEQLIAKAASSKMVVGPVFAMSCRWKGVAGCQNSGYNCVVCLAILIFREHSLNPAGATFCTTPVMSSRTVSLPTFLTSVVASVHRLVAIPQSETPL